jgi:hypothetical protein
MSTRLDDVAVPAAHISSIGVRECALLTSAIAARPLCSTENAGAAKRVQRSVPGTLLKNGPGGSSNHARAASDPEFADCETV